VIVRTCAGALVPLVLWCSGALLAAQRQPVFRTAADLVTVPVSVRASGTPVGGLRPEDFVVLDNGVPQKVESLTGESVPADITILVGRGHTVRPYLGAWSEQVAKISAMVRPTDRLEVLGIDTYIEELLPLKRASDQRPLGRLRPGGALTSVNDALVAALLREPDKQRPHLVIAITDTVDTMSMADMATVRDVAKQSGATLVIAWVTMSIDPAGGVDPVTNFPYWNTTSERETRAVTTMLRPPLGTDSSIPGGGGPAVTNGRSVPRARYWVPHYTPRQPRTIAAFDLLKEAAETTGGALHPPGVFVDRNAAAIFNKLYDDYRHSYIIRYSAEGVARDGWHEITVTTPKYPSYELHARKGYMVEPVKPPVDREKLPPGSLVALLAAEEAGDAAAVDRTIHENKTNADLLKLINDFKSGGNAFSSSPRKEFVLALDLAATALPLSFPGLRAGGYDLLTRYGKLVRQVSGEDEFEKLWLLAQLALAEAPVRPADAQKLVDAALKRFPNEPRFILAQAITSEESAQTKDANRVLANYDLAAADASTRDEALVRKARLLTRLNFQAEALLTLDKTGPIDNDAVVRFWRELIRGKTLDELGRLAEAAASFRAALVIAPEAQSARVALMNTLARMGQRDDARVIAEAIQTGRADADDPWWSFWQADYRFFPDLMKRLRELSK